MTGEREARGGWGWQSQVPSVAAKGRGASFVRQSTLRRLADERFDLLVVGGGSTGAAIARDGALRGLAVALVDAGDFAGETSSRSSRLVHGGVRYLQYGDLGLVFEALRERRLLMTIAPHLCVPTEFVFPAYRHGRPSLAVLRLGVAVYDALALWRPPAGSRHVRADEVHRMAPWLRAAGLEGALLYTDCRTDDARLVLEHVLDAQAAGAAAASYLAVMTLLRNRRGRAIGAEVVDREGGARFDVRATAVVNATGPFSDSFEPGRRRLRPTLGVHVAFDAARLPTGGRSVVLNHPRDGRLMFALPAGPRTVVGTTDTDWPAPPPLPGDPIRARGVDVDYILEAVNHAFPPAGLSGYDVLSAWAGLRPLVADPSATPSATSREHEILVEDDGVLTIIGGKLTTMRSMAEECVDRSLELLAARGFEGAIAPCETGRRPLPGGHGLPDLDHEDLADDVRARVLAAYGSRASAVLDLAHESDDLRERIDPELPYLWAEVAFAARHDGAVDLEDVLARRLNLLRDARDQGLGPAARAADIMARELDWPDHRKAAAIGRYRASVAVARRWEAEI